MLLTATALTYMRDKPKRCPVRTLKKRLRPAANVEMLAPAASIKQRREILAAAELACESCPFFHRC